MRKKFVITSLIAALLLILGLPIAVAAQNYRYYDNRDYARNDSREVRNALRRLDNSSARLESDLNFTGNRRVFGFFWVRDNSGIYEARNFHQAVRNLWNASNGGRDLSNSYDQARVVLDMGARLDRDLRFRNNNGRLDSDMADIRANLRTIADAYGLQLIVQTVAQRRGRRQNLHAEALAERLSLLIEHQEQRGGIRAKRFQVLHDFWVTQQVVVGFNDAHRSVVPTFGGNEYGGTVALEAVVPQNKAQTAHQSFQTEQVKTVPTDEADRSLITEQEPPYCLYFAPSLRHEFRLSMPANAEGCG